ncbi:MAG: SDR family NAD(P)-dependent oxidoreductase [Mycolicibacterium fortuitum]|uniref:SDR family NAD(P)-dependent oxidoreductase n=1 Tax=Mycolicibacterium fortuitum TaxID=1766 RepID=UPI0022BA6E77|nr:SDR family NAD(P)-dependent oxidoreductase [Mycolicibacterium fortuitum]WAY19754.1 SDR family NAD(P)-dependent oxidoreductase [Mycolicibacterium fortuitum]
MRKPLTGRLRGKVVLITGGAQGIGGCLARQLIDHGCRVAILDHDITTAQHLAGELGSAAAFDADVTSAESMRTACAAAADHFGGVDVVVANAGIAGPGATIEAVDPAEWRRVIDVNVVGVFHTMAAALPYVRRRRGYIMAVASLGAVVPGPTVSGYMASKAAVESLVRSLRVELAGTGVKAGTAYFGLIDTGLAASMMADSGLGVVMAKMPAAVGKPIPVERAATAIAAAISRRGRRAYAPGWVSLALDLRVPFAVVGDRLLALSPAVRRVVRDAEVLS